MLTNKEVIDSMCKNRKFDAGLKIQCHYANFYTIALKTFGYVCNHYIQSVGEDETQKRDEFFKKMAVVLFGIRPNEVRYYDDYVYFDYYDNQQAVYQ